MNNSRLILAFLSILILTNACSARKKSNQNSEDRPTNFFQDKTFLEKYDPQLIELSTEDQQAKVLVSPKYQGKVFTSTAAGDDGESFGWINYEAFDGPLDKHMNAYGGESRLWLGPEGNTFSLFFEPGKKMEFENWHTPAAIDHEAWEKIEAGPRDVSMVKSTSITNYQGTEFALMIQRTVTLLEKEGILANTGLTADISSIRMVGYETINSIQNTGDFPWTCKTGAPCIWVLDMFKPSPETTIVLPLQASETNEGLTTNYFGTIPQERIAITDNYLFLKADGQSRGKVGVSPDRALPMAASYDPLQKVLTISTFDIKSELPYLNQEWNTETDPFKGDAVNAYNDGPLGDGSQMGPFYELESVSPAAFLSPGESMAHFHHVYHFTGDESTLGKIARQLLGISIAEINEVFNPQ
ncbi:hypothetical protein SAMN04488057_102415 [Cyclobacterium lianum]|uniref:Methane oxygenase PmoA n=1 Tax=Cyclobacterium lianum TaxID=388280 RepID=A0A1M7KED5_9BACT|nr:DUF6786 family protein [Cyclobacterium lianum]SHM63625.1 hypothetical protein SAMN04488057_102415 [Cyclobacterium lianum]